MFQYTTQTKARLEEIFKELGYTIRYEKGNFQNGYCLVEEKKVVVINKFHPLEGKINSLTDILVSIVPDSERLSEKSRTFLRKLVEKKEQ